MTINRSVWKVKNNNLKIQPVKFEFLKSECFYLGLIITEHGIKPDSKKVKSLLEFPTPTNELH